MGLVVIKFNEYYGIDIVVAFLKETEKISFYQK